MNDFTFVDNWFYNKYFLKLETGHRFWTMHTAISLFLQRGSKTIVETGCIRMEEDWGAGMSTLVFSDISNRYNKKFETVDINIANLNFAKEYIYDELQFIEDFITYHHSDSIEFFRQHKQSIDLLYLDSLDFDFANPEESQKHCLAELETAFPHLSEKAIVLMDDNRLPGGGKPAKAKLWLQQQGWTCVMDYHQTLWVKNL